MASPPGNAIYADYIAQQVAREEARKASLEARGLAAVTASGAFATVLLGVVTLAQKDGKGFLPLASHGWVQAALAFFAVGAVLAILTNAPVPLKWASPDGLLGLINDAWADDVPTSEKTVAENRIELLKSLVSWNDLKGYILAASMGFQGVAVVMVAVAVWQAL